MEIQINKKKNIYVYINKYKMSLLINLLLFMLSCFAVYKAYKRNEKSHVIVKVLWMIFAFFMSIPYLIGILIYDKFVKRESGKDSEKSDSTITDSGKSDPTDSENKITDNTSEIDNTTREQNETKKVTFAENDVEIEGKN